MKPIYDVLVFKSILNFAQMGKEDKQIKAIAEHLKYLRIEKGYVSYEYFAWEHKIPRVQYWRMEKGSNFTLKSLLRVLNAHNLTLQEFFEGMKKE